MLPACKIVSGALRVEVLAARGLNALRLYAARSLSYEGMEYELVENALTPEQIRIYDAYARGFRSSTTASTSPCRPPTSPASAARSMHRRSPPHDRPSSPPSSASSRT